MPIDYSQYHPKWRLISKLIRVNRAQNKCEWCGADNYKPHPITGSKVVLTVAHIDRDKTNNRFYNLAALCQKCHLGHDIKQHIANRKYGRDHKGKHQTEIPYGITVSALISHDNAVVQAHLAMHEAKTPVILIDKGIDNVKGLEEQILELGKQKFDIVPFIKMGYVDVFKTGKELRRERRKNERKNK